MTGDYVGGDRSDVQAGRACPHCRALLTGHNKAVWDAGYAVGQRHMRDEVVGAGRKPTDEEAEAILTLVKSGWLKLELAL